MSANVKKSNSRRSVDNEAAKAAVEKASSKPEVPGIDVAKAKHPTVANEGPRTPVLANPSTPTALKAQEEIAQRTSHTYSCRMVLVGAGHAHSQVVLSLTYDKVKSLAMKAVKRQKGAAAVKEFEKHLSIELTLISPSQFAAYSGMTPGGISGLYNLRDFMVDVPQTCQRNGWKFIEEEVQLIDTANQNVLLKTGEYVEFDILSVNMGSDSPDMGIAGLNERAIKTRPINEFIVRLYYEIETIKHHYDPQKKVKKENKASQSSENVAADVEAVGTPGSPLKDDKSGPTLNEGERESVDSTAMAMINRVIGSFKRNAEKNKAERAATEVAEAGGETTTAEDKAAASPVKDKGEDAKVTDEEAGSTNDLEGMGSPAKAAAVPMAPKKDDPDVLAVQLKKNPPRGRGQMVRVLVLGAGAAGVELGFAMKQRLMLEGFKPDVTVVDANANPLKSYEPKVREKILRVMQKHGIRFIGHCRIAEVRDGKAITDNRAALPFNILISSLGAQAPVMLRRCVGIPLTDEGYFAVDNHLRAVGTAKAIFGAGDCIHMEGTDAIGENIPKAGVYAVRQGPVLVENLSIAIEQKAVNDSLPDSILKPYKPQNDFLSLIMCGDGTAIGSKWGKVMHNHKMWQLKDYIDRKWMTPYLSGRSENEIRGYVYDLARTAELIPKNFVAADVGDGAVDAAVGTSDLNSGAGPSSSVASSSKEPAEVGTETSETVTAENINGTEQINGDPDAVQAKLNGKGKEPAPVVAETEAETVAAA
eukprot:Clim_evm3s159 gene=Clim_evmTU3s159